jgi:shikimate dehydrogenase
MRVAGMRAAVLGSPIRHSLSPILHAAAYRELGLTDWSYDAIECDAAGLAALLDSLGPEWAGLSLTMPLKRAVLPLLDEAEQLVTDVGGANTVVLRAGRRAGYNTDVPGMFTALREARVGLTGEVLVLGGGATACSALAALRRARVTEVVIAVRDASRAGLVREVGNRLGLRIRLAGLTSDGVRVSEPGLGGSGRAGIRPAEVARPSEVGRSAGGGPAGGGSAGGGSGGGGSGGGGSAGGGQPWRLLISTVPAGAADGVARQLAAGAVTAEAVFDVVYDPWPTLLAHAAMAAGATVISGFELLLNQAAGQVELMTGQQAPVAAMRADGMAEIARRRAC